MYLCVEVDVGLIGLSLAYSVSLAGIFQYGVRLSGEVENLVSSAVVPCMRVAIVLGK